MSKLARNVLLPLLALILLLADSHAQKEFAFTYHSIDSIPLHIYVCKDDRGIMSGYKAHIETPVCEDQRCEEVKLDLYWDLMGDFSRFAVDTSRSLTKVDHVPFTQADYDRLDGILRSKNPSFIHLRKSELVENLNSNLATPIDGISGATVQAVKQDMVPGAVYTCYTLWHLANGGVSFQLAEQTRKRLDDDLIQTLLDRDDLEVHHFLLEHLSAEDFRKNLEKLAGLGDMYGSYFASRILRRIQPYDLDKPYVQRLIYQHFPTIGPPDQNHLITMIQNSQVNTTAVKKYLIQQLNSEHANLNEKIIDLIIYDSTRSGDLSLLPILLKILIEQELILTEHRWSHMYELIKSDRSLRNKMRRIPKL